MKKTLISSAVAVLSALAFSTGSVNAGTPAPPAPPVTVAAAPLPPDAYVESAGPAVPTTVASAAPVTTAAPVLTVPSTRSPLPVTGGDSNSTLAAGAIVLGVGGAMVLVGRTRRRRTVPAG